MTLSFEDRDSIALKVIWDNYGDFHSLNVAIDSGEFDFSTVRRLIREGVALAADRTAEGNEEDYQWGTRWPAAEMLTQKPVIYLEESREAALKTLEDDRVACVLEKPRGTLVKRLCIRREGDWEEA